MNRAEALAGHRRALAIARRRRTGEGPCGRSLGEQARWLRRAAGYRVLAARSLALADRVLAKLGA